MEQNPECGGSPKLVRAQESMGSVGHPDQCVLAQVGDRLPSCLD